MERNPNDFPFVCSDCLLCLMRVFSDFVSAKTRLQVCSAFLVCASLIIYCILVFVFFLCLLCLQLSEPRTKTKTKNQKKNGNPKSKKKKNQKYSNENNQEIIIN